MMRSMTIKQVVDEMLLDAESFEIILQAMIDYANDGADSSSAIASTEWQRIHDALLDVRKLVDAFPTVI